jgi:hypothetical protein
MEKPDLIKGRIIELRELYRLAKTDVDRKVIVARGKCYVRALSKLEPTPKYEI